MERLDWGIGGWAVLQAHSKKASARLSKKKSAKCGTSPWAKEKFPGPRALYNHLALTVRKVYFSVMYVMSI